MFFETRYNASASSTMLGERMINRGKEGGRG
jgi:hypothetical protein